MSSVEAQLPPRFRRVKRDARELVADLRLAALVRYGRLRRRVGRRWLGRRRERGVARGQLIVAFTNEESARTQALAALRLAIARTQPLGDVRLIRVRRRDRKPDERQIIVVPVEEEPDVRRGLTRSYAGVSTPPGLEDIVLRAIHAAGWRYGLPRGRRGLIAVRPPTVVPALGVRGTGRIDFTDEYEQIKELVGANAIDASGVTIMVVDTRAPDRKLLPADVNKRLTIRDEDVVPAGTHASLITRVVADIAHNANIVAVSLTEEGGENDEAPWALMDVLLEDEPDVQLIVASVSLAESSGRRTRGTRGRQRTFVDALLARRFSPRRPPVLCPTGNLDAGIAPGTLAAPARFVGTIGVGSVVTNSDGRLSRSEGSRYGVKDGEAPSAWWLAPGGAFRRRGEITRPFVTVDGVGQAGTSIANAFAGGLLAGVVGRLQASAAAPDGAVTAAYQQVEATVATVPDSTQALTLLDGLATRHTGSITFGLLTEECERIAKDELIDGYFALEHGGGVLCHLSNAGITSP